MATLIEDHETEALLRKLAERRGTDLNGAIRLAVENERAREPEQELRLKRSPEEMKAGLREIQARYAARREVMTPEEVDAWMYDENGLPH